MMDRFEEIWRAAAADLGLDIVAPYRLELPDKTELEFKVLLKNFGWRNGMLVTDDWSQIREYEDAVIDLGFGYSILGPYTERATYNRENYIEMLSDWTWSGPETDKPKWLLDPSDDS
jgi:hypothetical protein